MKCDANFPIIQFHNTSVPCIPNLGFTKYLVSTYLTSGLMSRSSRILIDRKIQYLQAFNRYSFALIPEDMYQAIPQSIDGAIWVRVVGTDVLDLLCGEIFLEEMVT